MCVCVCVCVSLRVFIRSPALRLHRSSPSSSLRRVTILFLLFCSSPSSCVSSVLRWITTQTHIYVHTLLIFQGNFHFTSPVKQTEESVIRIEIEPDLQFLTDWTYSISKLDYLITWPSIPMKVAFSNDLEVFTCYSHRMTSNGLFDPVLNLPKLPAI